MNDLGSKSTSKDGLSLEERKFAQESASKIRELELREREVFAKEIELRRSRWLNPTVFGLFAAALGLTVNLFVTYLNNTNSQNVERSREQSSLIIQAIGTGNPLAACKNLISFIHLGLLDDPSGTISRCEANPETIPVLPASVRIYSPPDETPLASQMAAIVTKADERDHYRFEVTFTVPQPPFTPYTFDLVVIYAYQLDNQERRTDMPLTPLRGSWKVGDRITISADLPKNYVDDTAHRSYLRYCVGSVAACIPSANLLLPKG